MSPQERLASRNESFSKSFPLNVLEEARSLRMKREHVLSRQLVRGVTIDPLRARDLDDAFSIKENPDGFQLAITFSDVTAFIEKDSFLEQEARKRRCSLYKGVGRVVRPMFPTQLSEDLLSLRKRQLRFGYLCSFTI